MIVTYKHDWFSCHDCGNVFGKRKDTFAASLLPVWLLRPLPEKWRLKLLSQEDVQRDASRSFDYMLAMDTDVGTKYENEFKKFKDQVLIKYGFDVADKTILDISGGPGFFARDLAAEARLVVMTEFNQQVVSFARNRLGVESFVFDFNKDVIGEKTNRKFDVVIIRYAINYCLDIGRFLAQLTTILNKGAIVLICGFKSPTLGEAIRWQFDDYTFPTLYNPETMMRIFREQGFSLIVRFYDGTYHYNSFIRWPQAALNHGYWLLNLLNIRKTINRESSLKNICMIFQWDGSATETQPVPCGAEKREPLRASF